MDKDIIKQVLLEQESADRAASLGIEREQLTVIDSLIPLSHTIIISGIRRCGKSTLMRQILKKHYGDGVYFTDFEDERFVSFTAQDALIVYKNKK